MHKNNILVDILGEKIKIREVPFFYLKNFTKDLAYSDDDDEIFESLLSFIYDGQENLNYIQKVILLLHSRSLIYGNNIEFQITKEKHAYIDINQIIDFFNKTYKKADFNYNGVKYTFDYPKNIKLNINKIDFIGESLVSINDKIIDRNAKDYIDLLPAINFIDMFDRIMLSLYQKEFNIDINKTTITLTNIMQFIKMIFHVELTELYDMEYTLRKYLNFNSDDLKNVSLPECKIFINYFISDQKKQEKKYNQQLNASD